MLRLLISLVFMSLLLSCDTADHKKSHTSDIETTEDTSTGLLEKYTEFKLTTDLSVLSDNQRQMIKILIEASKEMDDMFWYDAYGTE